MDLPNETLSTIFDELPPSALAAVACVSVRFNAVAERILYSSVYIYDLLPASSPSSSAFASSPAPLAEDPSSFLPSRTIKWCAAMRARSHLHDSVRRLHVRWQQAPLDPSSSARSTTAAVGLGMGEHDHQQQEEREEHQQRCLMYACDQLAGVLPLLTELDSLDLFLGPANLVLAPHARLSHSSMSTSMGFRGTGTGTGPPPMHAIERVIQGCAFAHLRACTLGADSAKGAPPYTGVLVRFLGALPALRHLRLSDLAGGSYYQQAQTQVPWQQMQQQMQMSYHDTNVSMSINDYTARLDTLPASALPHLTSFRGSAAAAASLLPGRPVQFLALVGQDSDVTRENLPRMTRTSLPLRFLDLSAMSVRPVLLRNVSAFLPSVEGLKVKLALRHTLHYSFSGIRILMGLSSVLTAFPHLALLDLSPTGIDGVGRADAREELALCTEWQRACPTLRRVIFPSQTEWECALDPGAGAGGMWTHVGVGR